MSQTGIEPRSSRISPPSYHISLENNDAYLNPYDVEILFMSIKFGWQWPFNSVQCKCKVWLLDNRKFSIRKPLIGGELKTFWMQSKLLKLSLRFLYERKSLNYLQSWFHSTYVIPCLLSILVRFVKLQVTWWKCWYFLTFKRIFNVWRI